MLLPSGPQLGVYTRRAIRLARTRVNGPHPLQQRGVSNRVRRRRPLPPGVIPGLGHAEHACHGRDPEAGLVRAHEFEDRDGIAPVSRARPRLERGYRAPAAAACSHAVAGPTRRARPPPAPLPSPPGGPPADPPAPPNGRSIARSARTRGQGQSDRGQRGPTPPSDDETQGNTAGVSSPCEASNESLRGSTKPGQLQSAEWTKRTPRVVRRSYASSIVVRPSVVGRAIPRQASAMTRTS